MNESVHQLVQSLLEKNSIEECNLQDLQNIAKQFPYFAPIQLILSEKMKSQHPALYQKQLQKTSLYFHNALWFDYLINRDEYPMDELIISLPVEQAESSANDDLIQEQIINKDEWITFEENDEQTTQEYSLPVDNEQQQTKMNDDEAQLNSADHQMKHERAENTEEINTSRESAKEETHNSIPEDRVKHQESFIHAEESQMDSQHNDYGKGPIEKENPVDTGENGKEEIQFAAETMIGQVPEPPIAVIEKKDEDDTRRNEPAAITGIHEDIKLPGLKQEAQSESETVLAFEPYHTIDYFASQGIKLSADVKPGDRLGQQLRSFTDWLKTMKKLPQSEIAKNMDSGLEQKVQTLAEHSLETREVVTEAMAEVWEKQGNHEKAIETYNKLSLHNPAKSAYFAAKIEQLKKEN